MELKRLVGNTPVIPWGQYGKAVIHFKLEGANPTGALKDRTAAWILDEMERAGELMPAGRTLIDASSGSFGCSLAYFGARLEMPVTILANSKISATNADFIRACGATLVPFGDVTVDGYRECAKWVRENPKHFIWTRQLEHIASPDAHTAGTGPEIYASFGDDLTAVVCSIGSGACALGLGRYFQDLQNSRTPLFASVGIEDDEGKLAGTYLPKSDLETPFIAQLHRRKLVRTMYPVRWRKAMETTQELLRRGIPVGPQAAGVFLAAQQAIDEHSLSGNVLIIAGDHYLKNQDRFTNFH